MNRIVYTALAALSLTTVGAFAQKGDTEKCTMPCCQSKTAQATSSVTAKQSKGVQKVTVKVDGGYSPASISVKAGKPVEITFIKGKNVGCGDTVVFSSLGITKELKGEKTIVAFTPKKAGIVAFACPMNMYKGSVVAK